MLELKDVFHEYHRLTQVDWDIINREASGIYVEVGTNHGTSSCAAASNDNVESVDTIDIYDWQPKIYETLWPKLSKKITFHKGTSQDFCQSYLSNLSNTEHIDTLFIDGSHEYEYVLKDCQTLVPFVKKNGIVLFHDHNPNNPATGVYRAVNDYLKTIEHEKFPKIEGSSNLLKVRKLC